MAKKWFDDALLTQLEQLRVHFFRHASGQSGGARRSKYRGISAEFSDFREYRQGDDFRRIDWNAYARFRRLILKLFMEERQMQVRLFLDVSESMNRQSKLDMAKRLSAVLAYLAIGSYDQAGFYPLGEVPGEIFPMTTGKAAFVRMLDYLEGISVQKKTNLSQAIQRVGLSRTSGTAFVLTDGFTADGLETALDYLRYHKQDTTLVHILSREELAPSFDGDVRLIDSESGESIEMEPNPQVLHEYQQELKKFCSQLKEMCCKRGAHYALIPADMDIQEAIFTQLLQTR